MLSSFVNDHLVEAGVLRAAFDPLFVLFVIAMVASLAAIVAVLKPKPDSSDPRDPTRDREVSSRNDRGAAAD